MPYGRKASAIRFVSASFLLSSISGLAFTLFSTVALIPTEAQARPYSLTISRSAIPPSFQKILLPENPRSTVPFGLSQWFKIRRFEVGESVMVFTVSPVCCNLNRVYAPYRIPFSVDDDTVTTPLSLLMKYVSSVDLPVKERITCPPFQYCFNSFVAVVTTTDFFTPCVLTFAGTSFFDILSHKEWPSSALVRETPKKSNNVKYNFFMKPIGLNYSGTKIIKNIRKTRYFITYLHINT